MIYARNLSGRVDHVVLEHNAVGGNMAAVCGAATTLKVGLVRTDRPNANLCARCARSLGRILKNLHTCRKCGIECKPDRGTPEKQPLCVRCWLATDEPTDCRLSKAHAGEQLTFRQRLGRQKTSS